MKTLLTLLLAALFPLMVSAALAQPRPEEKKAEEQAKPEAVKPKPDDEVVIDIKRSGPPECYPKPVMTDAEIETCKRARELWNQKK